MRRNNWGEDDTELLKLLYSQGMPVKSIAAEMEWSDTTVETWIQKLGLSRIFRWDEDKDTILKELVFSGKTSKEIAAVLGCKDDTVKRRKVNLGLSLRKGTNSITEDELKKHNSALANKQMLVVEYKGMKGTSLIQCTKCSTTWNSRVADILNRDQECPTCYPRNTSKVATEWLNSLDVPIREYHIHNTKFRVDGYDPDSNTVYEFLGDYWHGNPETFDPEEIHPTIGCTYQELHQETVVDRFNKLKEFGYIIKFIWEKDYKIGKIPQLWQ